MISAGIDPTFNPDPWRFQPHPEVWLLVIGLVLAFVYAIRTVGPKVQPRGEVISPRQVRIFILMIVLLWLASDWPMHDLAEEYLYNMHMIQHLVLSYMVPPLALMATPTWLFRLLIGEGRTYRVVRFLVRPVSGIVAYGVTLMITHIPQLVNRSAEGGPLHYLLHVLIVLTSLMFWFPICGPIAEWRIGWGAKMIYLFSTSILSTVPAGWLAMAEGTVYKHYDTPVRVWGVSVISDQQAAGAIMKLGGSVYMWVIIIVIFFRKFIGNFYAEQSYERLPDGMGAGQTLTYEQVEAEFERTPPAPENGSD